MATRYAERLLAGRSGAAQLARMQGRDRPVARRGPPAPAGPAVSPAGAVPDRAAQGAHRRHALRRAAQHRARPAAPPECERQERQRPPAQPARQVQRQPDRIRPRRAGPDDRHDMPARPLAQTVEEILRRRRLRSRPRVTDAVDPWPVTGSAAVPSRPDASAPAASHVGPGIVSEPRNPVSAPRAAAPGPGIEEPRTRTHDRSAFIARAPP